MDRRGFLKSTGAAAALAATTTSSTATTAELSQPGEVPSPSLNTQPTLGFRLAVPWTDTVAGPADLAHRLATRIRETSSGRIRLNVDYSSSTDAEFVHASEHSRAATHPAFSYFAGLPAASGLDATDLEAWVVTGGGQDLWDELSADLGDKPLLAGHLGPNPVLWSNRALVDRASLRGLRIALDGPSADLTRALGATPVQVAPADLARALANGDVDAVEQGATLNAMAIGLPAASRFAVSPSFTPAGTAIALRIRRDIWENLSQADQALISACASQAYRTSLSEARLAERLLRDTLRSRGGPAAQHMPAEISCALPAVSEAVVAALAGHDEASRRINASYMMFRRQVAPGLLEGSPIA
ncbi:MAG: twin-arginine translocation signal domain-containing protein [Alphaproteobacteria bacterium]|nr:twin-arginine translocation signal domain-containing protein [Alphaproteobacteria bacterium]